MDSSDIDLSDEVDFSGKCKVTSFTSEPEIRREFGHHQRGIARINNGSFGSCPASVISAQRKWQMKFLQQPDDFVLNQLKKYFLDSRTAIKKLINADDIEEISLVDNATTGAAIVLQHIGRKFIRGIYGKGDAVIMFSCTYGAVKNSVHNYIVQVGGSVIEVPFPFPVRSDEEIVSRFRQGLEKAKVEGLKIKLAIIDHISSMPAVLLPVVDIVRMCKDEGVDQVLVDAAHAAGSVRIDVKEVGADYYVSNLHKWFFTPPSAAILYCRQDTVPAVEVNHLVTSHQYGKGLPTESSWVGTRDYSSQLVIPQVIEFMGRFEGGIEGIMRRNHDSVVQMGEMLVKCWGTMLGSPPDMCAGMIMVGLPSRLCISNQEDALRLRSHLRSHYGIEVHVYYNASKDADKIGPTDMDGLVTGFARISHQVYNIPGDYYRFRDAINQLVKDGFTCRKLEPHQEPKACSS